MPNISDRENSNHLITLQAYVIHNIYYKGKKITCPGARDK